MFVRRADTTKTWRHVRNIGQSPLCRTDTAPSSDSSYSIRRISSSTGPGDKNWKIAADAAAPCGKLGAVRSRDRVRHFTIVAD
jgi:hypothetical protein